MAPHLMRATGAYKSRYAHSFQNALMPHTHTHTHTHTHKHPPHPHYKNISTVVMGSMEAEERH